MLVQPLSPALAERAAELTKHGLPPQPIRELVEDIQGDIRVARFRQAMTGRVDGALAVVISAKKRQLKTLYRDWVEGKSLV